MPIPGRANTLIGTWTAGPAMVAAHDDHSATVLKDGRVLVVSLGAEIFDPSTNRWSPAGSPAIKRTNHSATLLADGRVLVVGGIDSVTGRSVPEAEIYDPAANAWTVVASLAGRRYQHTATLLADGRVLVAGGTRSTVTLDTAELYDPAKNSWSVAANLTTARTGHSAVRLPDSRVLVVGGNGPDLRTSAEIYDPATNKWSAVEPMSQARSGASAALLSDGRVLVVGGEPSDLSTSVFAEIFDPDTGFWSPAGLTSQPLISYGPATAILVDGRVLVCGGAPAANPAAASAAAFVYDLARDRWYFAAAMGQARVYHTASLLNDGRILVAGGRDAYTNGTPLATTELFDAGPAATTARPIPASLTSLRADRALPVWLLPLVVASVAALVATLVTVAMRRRGRRSTV